MVPILQDSNLTHVPLRYLVFMSAPLRNRVFMGAPLASCYSCLAVFLSRVPVDLRDVRQEPRREDLLRGAGRCATDSGTPLLAGGGGGDDQKRRQKW